MKPNSKPVHPEVRIGHIHLKVADLDRALAFYREVLGFELTQRYGDQAAFLSAGGYHHHIGLNTWEIQGGSPPHRGATGLYHVAIVYPTRAELADALRRLIQASIRLEGASDHGVSEALYLRPRWEWSRTLLGPAPEAMAQDSGRAAEHGYGTARSGSAAQGSARARSLSTQNKP